MKTITVEVKQDHLETLSKTRKPIIAVAELIWNGLDADASEVRVQFDDNGLSGLDTIRVLDNGHGIRYDDAEAAFSSLGGSWKRGERRTRQGQRMLHGRLGKGRFRAFSLGKQVEWQTFFADNGDIRNFTVTGKVPSLGTFSIGDPSDSQRKTTGTQVEISGIDRNYPSLRGRPAVQEITELFALYLRQYRSVGIVYDGITIDPADAEQKVADFNLESFRASDGTNVEASLTIIEWATPTGRALYLCDKDGFALEETPPGVHARGFNFTAYLKSEYLRDLDEQGALVLEDLHPDLKKLLDLAKAVMRDYFRKREAESASGLVEEWKKDDVYPYQGEPEDVIETAERQVFDVCALNVNTYLPGFGEADTKSKRFAFRMLRNALETSPSHVGRILQEVLELPVEKQEELAEMLERTSLEAIVTAAKTVADRLNFLKGLETIIFDKKIKKDLLERRQLHRLLSGHTWIFGERFHLSNDDESLTEVLRQHLAARGSEVDILEPVVRENATEGIVDLVLSRRIPMPDAHQREHLVIELKRPTVKIDPGVLNQVEEYAFAVANDERFRDTDTRWSFWAVSNDMSENARKRARQRGKPSGMTHESEDGQLTIWVKTWGEILNDCRARLEFFQNKLKYHADRDSGLDFLRKTHERYLPKAASEPAGEKAAS